MSENTVENAEGQDSIDGRKRYQKDLSLKAGEQKNFGEVKKCRKIYTSVKKGTIKFEVSGRYSSDLECSAGFTGGVLSSGGGDFEPGTLNIRIIALVDSDFYIHIEWLEGSIITVGG
ncbi:hypothetical protein [Cellvibrio sp. QJXJ]|uniref:hypothetical protein n=1 Tax=Cellvibrio sp. QJXJ TaxID=2964606 RepID=UPI0021C308BD|nr:hypothetical protein [Cellvibrio sp. QJXJ]UUA72104.1 hypothetical protein NNX04_17000 [Cellvibrio sp. QJXJ]